MNKHINKKKQEKKYTTDYKETWIETKDKYSRPDFIRTFIKK